MNRCCPQPNTVPATRDTKTKNTRGKARSHKLTQDTFLSASYFLAMLLTLSAFPVLLRASRATGNSETLFSNGCLGIAILLFSVVSFLYYSEQEPRLKTHFANLRIVTLSAIPLLFWWAFNNASIHTSGTDAIEWAVVFGLCSSLLLLFMGFVIRLTQKQLLTCYLFLSAALCVYGALLIKIPTAHQISAMLWSAGLIGGLGFVLQTQSKFRKKCQNVEWLLLLSVMLQASSLLLFNTQ